VSTIPNQPADGRRRRRIHSDDFKADAVASCMRPGVSMASVAMSHGINANLLRRWVQAAEMRAEAVPSSEPAVLARKASTAATSFVPLSLPAPNASSEVRIELRRGAMSITVAWPAGAAIECAAWMRELLR
jgi:transposase